MILKTGLSLIAIMTTAGTFAVRLIFKDQYRSVLIKKLKRPLRDKIVDQPVLEQEVSHSGGPCWPTSEFIRRQCSNHKVEDKRINQRGQLSLTMSWRKNASLCLVPMSGEDAAYEYHHSECQLKRKC